MARIERWEAHIWCIWENLWMPIKFKCSNTSGKASKHHYHIGNSGWVYQHIGIFLWSHNRDPAIKVSFIHCVTGRMSVYSCMQNYLSKLKKHLAECILADAPGDQPPNTDNIAKATGSVFFKHNHIYDHKIFHINYTTYHTCWAQDVINPDTPHCNIMLPSEAAQRDVDDQSSLFLYARVLAVCHVNIVYIGPGAVYYQPHQMKFLWVRWYEQLDLGYTGWKSWQLDCTCFPSISGGFGDESFGFVDPSTVMQISHMIPNFWKGKWYSDGKGVSFYGRDSSDWNEYYVNRWVSKSLMKPSHSSVAHLVFLIRFVDHDMLMQFHLRLAIGHTYHDFNSVLNHTTPYTHDHSSDPVTEAADETKFITDSDGMIGSVDGGREYEVDFQDDGEIDEDDVDNNDVEFLALHEMYE